MIVCGRGDVKGGLVWGMCVMLNVDPVRTKYPFSELSAEVTALGGYSADKLFVHLGVCYVRST